MNEIKVNISTFASCLGYCENRIHNYFKLGIKPKVSRYQLIGHEIHKELEEEDKKIERVIATEKELKDPKVDLDITREQVDVLIIRKNENIFNYVGRIDKVIRTKGNLYIIDNKTKSSNKFDNKIWLDQRLQLFAYCEGFKKNYRNIKFNKIFIKIIQNDLHGDYLGEIKEEYNKKTKQFLLQHFKRFEAIYNEKEAPQQHSNINRCNACGYNHLCSFRTVN